MGTNCLLICGSVSSGGRIVPAPGRKIPRSGKMDTLYERNLIPALENFK
jgi:hypothetical protein